MNVPAISRLRLVNGMQVILWPHPSGNSVAGVLSLGVGSRYESRGNWGIAHFLEHIISKKTDLWENPLEFARQVELAGMYYNAYTWIYNTAYVFGGQADQVEQLLEYLNQIVFHPRLTAPAVAEEKGIIAQEWRRAWDNPERYADILVDELKYRGHPLAVTTLGTYDSIQQLSLTKLVKFYRCWYDPSNAVLVLVGNFDPARVKELVQRKFNRPSRRRVPRLNRYYNNQTSPRLVFGQRPTKQVQVRFDFKGPGIAIGEKGHFKEVWALMVLLAMLADGDASIFQHELIDQKMLVSEFSAALVWNYEVSSLEIAFAGKAQTMLDNLLAVVEIYNRIKMGEYESEIKRAKQILKTFFVFDHEDFFARADLLARYFHLTGRIFSSDDLLSWLDAVTTLDLIKVARRYLVPGNAALAWVGSRQPDMAKIKRILGNLKT